MKKTCNRPINPKTGKFYTEKSKAYKEWAESLTPEQLTEEQAIEQKEAREKIYREFRRLGLA
jgi:hypothetical protein